MEYSRVFFVERYTEWPKNQLEVLRKTLIVFLDTCKIGIEKHESMCETENDNAFHNSLLQGLEKTVASMDSHWQDYLRKSAEHQ